MASSRFNEIEKKVDILWENSIVADLSEERFAGSGKPKYSYADIADKYKISTYEVTKVAQANNLLRKKQKNA